MQQLFNLGTTADPETYDADKVRFSNIYALILTLAGAALTIYSIVYVPSLAIYPSGILLFSASVWLLNTSGLISFSRLILTVMVPLMFFLFHSFMVPPKESVLPSMFVLQFALTFIPWVVFEWKESMTLFFVLLASSILLLCQSYGINFLEAGITKQDYSMASLNTISYISGYAIVLSGVLMLLYYGQKHEGRIGSLQKEVLETREMMDNQQKELKQTLEEINKVRDEEGRRNWVNEGLARLDELLRGKNDEEIYYSLVSFVVKHMKANQGGLFTVEDDVEGNAYLKLGGCYAYDRKKFMEKQLDLEEGLLGQAYLEKDVIYLKDIPDNYVNITSGLGQANPKSLLIAPMIVDEKVNGLIEIAAFQNLEQHEIEFAKEAARHIASYIEDFKFNFKNQQLLEETNMQAEEMRAQEEEMKQTMEEMQSIQEEMYRKEKEYVNRIAELEELLAKDKAREAEIKKYQ